MTTSFSLTRRSLLGGALGLAARRRAVGLFARLRRPSRPGASVAGGGGAEGYDGPPVELAFWNGLTGGDGPIMQKLIDKFNTEHPNIKVSMTAITWAEYYQKLPAAVSNGKAPEIGMMHDDDLATNAARQVISRWTTWPTALKLTEEDFAAIAWNGGLYKDKRYGIPLDMHPAGLYYNKTVLEKVGADPEKPPTTGDELMAILDSASPKVSRACGPRPSASTVCPSRPRVPVRRQDGQRRRRTVGSDEEPGVKGDQLVEGLIDEWAQPGERRRTTATSSRSPTTRPPS